MTPEQRIAALKAYYLDQLVEDPQDGSATDVAVLNAFDQLFATIGKPKPVITLADMPITQHATKHPNPMPGFEAVGKSVTHIWPTDIDGEPTMAYTEFCKCRSPEWASRVAEGLNKLYPEGKIPEDDNRG
jgi:hypothetical protein